MTTAEKKPFSRTIKGLILVFKRIRNIVLYSISTYLYVTSRILSKFKLASYIYLIQNMINYQISCIKRNLGHEDKSSDCVERMYSHQRS